MSRILVLGTSSGAGKTTFCAMLCRYLARRGLDPVPFKGLNLSLNSYATADGGEIGIGQAFQAWSAGLEPETDMNPVLLKPSGGGVIQLVLNGRPSQDVSESRPMDRTGALEEAAEAFGRLSEKHGFVVCEGSGSPVELYKKPRSRFAASFLGDVNLLDAVAEGCENALLRIRTEIGTLFSVHTENANPPSVLIRPENIRVSTAPSEQNCFCAEYLTGTFLGERCELRFRTESGRILDVNEDTSELREAGKKYFLSVLPQNVVPLED